MYVLVDRSSLAYPAVAALYIAAGIISQSPHWTRHPEALAVGLLFDLTLTAAAILWLSGAMGSDRRWKTVAALFALGLTFAALTFPPNAVTDSDGFYVISIACRLALVVAALHGMMKAARQRQALILAGHPPYDASVRVLQDTLHLGRAAPAVASELLVVELALTGWRQSAPQGTNVFTVYKEGGAQAINLVLGVLVVIETVVLHLIVAPYSDSIAWFLTATSLYTLIWLIGDTQALRLRPVIVTADRVEINVGMRWRASVPKAHIKAVHTGEGPASKTHRNLSRPMFETVYLEFTTPVQLEGLFGIRRQARSIGLSIDEPSAFIEAVKPR